MITDFNIPACSIKIWINQKTNYHLFAWNSAPKSEKGKFLMKYSLKHPWKSIHVRKLKKHKNEALERFIGIFGVEEKKQNLVTITASQSKYSIWLAAWYFLKYSICNFAPKLITLWLSYLFGGLQCHIELSVIKDLCRAKGTHYLYFHTRNYEISPVSYIFSCYIISHVNYIFKWEDDDMVSWLINFPQKGL